MIEMNKNIAVKPNSYKFSFQKFDLTNGTGGCSTYCIRKTTLTLLLKGDRLMNLTSVTVKEKGSEISHNSLLCLKQIMEFLQLEERMLMKILNL
jgi:hypothetical protein